MPEFLQPLLVYILPFLALITVVITVHELGHFWAARACGIAIDRFSIGFGRPIFSRKDRTGVEWRVGWIPLGGYVRFAGDSNDASLPDDAELEDLRRQIVERYGPEALKKYYHFKPVWQRAFVAAAGPLANFALALVILTLLLTTLGQPMAVPRVAGVMPGTAAEAAGFMVGDVIRKANGRIVRATDDVGQLVKLRSGDPITFEVERAGRTVVLVATPRRTVVRDELTNTNTRLGQLGVQWRPRPEDYFVVRYGPVEAVGGAARMIVSQIGGTLNYLGRIVTGKESGDQLSGVIGMGQVSGSVAKAAAGGDGPLIERVANVGINLISFMAFISVGIGFVNLLPIPILDGGHLAFYAYEAIARRPVSAGFQAAGMRVGLALVLGLMLFATWNDLQRLRAFQFLGGLFS